MVRWKSLACAKATIPSWREAVTSVGHGIERKTEAPREPGAAALTARRAPAPTGRDLERAARSSAPRFTPSAQTTAGFS
jgi:hypothetical protein